MRKNVFLAGLFAFAGLTGIASAADLPARTYTKAPVPVVEPVTNWTGFYVGINGGYGWGQNTGFETTINPAGVAFGTGTPLPTGNVEKAKGGLAGGTIGYNWQMGAFVAGIESDLQWSGIKGSGSVVDPCCSPTPTPPAGIYTATQNLTWFGTTRGRLGWLATPNLLLFGTGGAFYGHEDVAAGIVFPPPGGFNYPTAAGTTRVGWTLGAGFEYLFANAWSAKLEGLYYDMGSVTSSFTCPPTGTTCTPGFTEQGTFALKGAIVRAGVNYHFNTPVVAKY